MLCVGLCWLPDLPRRRFMERRERFVSKASARDLDQARVHHSTLSSLLYITNLSQKSKDPNIPASSPRMTIMFLYPASRSLTTKYSVSFYERPNKVFSTHSANPTLRFSTSSPHARLARTLRFLETRSLYKYILCTF